LKYSGGETGIAHSRKNAKGIKMASAFDVKKNPLTNKLFAVCSYTMKETITDLLVKIPMFAGLDPDELEVIKKHIKLFEVKEGAILFQEGDQGDYVCFVVDGRLEITKRTIIGDDFVLNTLAKGQSVGELSIIDRRPRSATVRAKTEATLFTLTRDDFELIMKDYSEVSIKILKGLSLLLSKKLRQTSSRLVSYMATATTGS